jgi:hypothetical protein
VWNMANRTLGRLLFYHSLRQHTLSNITTAAYGEDLEVRWMSANSRSRSSATVEG